MPLESIMLRDVFPSTPKDIYDLWMDSEGHAHITGSGAVVEAHEGGAFEAWDGYISGRTEKLEPGRRIVQRWRTTEFPADAGDSRVEVKLREVDDGVELILIHTEIPEGQGEKYESGWVDFYFKPMRAFLGKTTSRAKPARAAKPKTAKPKATAKAPPAKKPARKSATRKTSKTAKSAKPAKRATSARRTKPAKRKAAARKSATRKTPARKTKRAGRKSKR